MKKLPEFSTPAIFCQIGSFLFARDREKRSLARSGTQKTGPGSPKKQQKNGKKTGFFGPPRIPEKPVRNAGLFRPAWPNLQLKSGRPRFFRVFARLLQPKKQQKTPLFFSWPLNQPLIRGDLAPGGQKMASADPRQDLPRTPARTPFFGVQERPPRGVSPGDLEVQIPPEAGPGFSWS